MIVMEQENKNNPISSWPSPLYTNWLNNKKEVTVAPNAAESFALQRGITGQVNFTSIFKT